MSNKKNDQTNQSSKIPKIFAEYLDTTHDTNGTLTLLLTTFISWQYIGSIDHQQRENIASNVLSLIDLDKKIRAYAKA
ncbi:MAG: hypothetical protein K8S00_12110 [Bacteroidales bacterium]|nr:hypothetical protein [Bacteroidales bacterium]